MKTIGVKANPDTNLNNLLQVNTFSIPAFQREFSWKKDAWTDLWEDIISSIENEKEHFFGFMTFKKEEKKKELIVIEGQQRITCVIIFLCAIRDLLLELEENKVAEKINDKYIFSEPNISVRENNLIPKLILSGRNNEFFSNNLLPLKKPFEKLELFNKTRFKTEVKSNKLLLECYKFFYNTLKNFIDEIDKAFLVEELLDIQNALLNNFKILPYEVVDNLTAYNIFQTLNDRGLRLATSDLLKIYLLEKAGNDWEKAKLDWDDLLEILNLTDVNIFLRHYWLSSHGIIKEKQLLNEIEKEIKTSSHVFKFLKILKEEAENYDSILNPQNYFGNESDITQLLLELQNLSLGQTLPLLLAGKKHFDDKEFTELVTVVTNYIFRYLTIGEKENKYIEGLFSKISIRIRNVEVKNIGTIVKELKNSEYIEDPLFKDTFRTKDFKSNAVPKYIFKKIEEYLKTPESWSKTISLEHIIPKSLDSKWKKYLLANNMKHGEYVNKIGNMTLLLGRINSQMKNAEFDEKRIKYYSLSQLQINKTLQEIKKFDKNSFNSRSNELAELAANIWKI